MKIYSHPLSISRFSFFDSILMSLCRTTTDESGVMASTKKESPSSPSAITTTTATTTALTDPNTHVRSLPPPPTYRLTITDLFDTPTGGGKPRLDPLREHLLAEGRLQEDAALMIIERGEQLLRVESTLIDIEAPITGTCRFNSHHHEHVSQY